MRSFAIQAVCDEKAVWDILTLLEQHRCTGILARPVGLPNGKALPAPKRKRNGKGQLATAENYIRAVQGPITPTGMKEALLAAGHDVRPHRFLFILKARGLIRKSGKAQYQLTKKGAL